MEHLRDLKAWNRSITRGGQQDVTVVDPGFVSSVGTFHGGAVYTDLVQELLGITATGTSSTEMEHMEMEGKDFLGNPMDICLTDSDLIECTMYATGNQEEVCNSQPKDDALPWSPSSDAFDPVNSVLPRAEDCASQTQESFLPFSLESFESAPLTKIAVDDRSTLEKSDGEPTFLGVAPPTQERITRPIIPLNAKAERWKLHRSYTGTATREGSEPGSKLPDVFVGLGYPFGSGYGHDKEGGDCNKEPM